MKKVIFSLAAAAMLGTAGFAAQAKNEGFYLGAGYGSASYKDNVLFDGSSSGFKLYGGYQFNQIIGIEMAFDSYGEYTNATYKESPTSFNIDANLGYAFLNGQLRPFVLLGISALSFTRDGYDHDGYGNEISKGSGGYNYGIGVTFKPVSLNGVGFRAGYETVKGSGDSLEVNGVTAYDFQYTFTKAYAGVEYQF